MSLLVARVRVCGALCGVLLSMLWAMPAWAVTETFPTELRWVIPSIVNGSNQDPKYLYEHSYSSDLEACKAQAPSYLSGVYSGPEEWLNPENTMGHNCFGYDGATLYQAGRTWQKPYCAALESWTGSCEVTCPDGMIWVAEKHQCLPPLILPLAMNPPKCDCATKVVADPGMGNPIYPLRGVKREVVDTGLRLGRLTLQFTYDSTARIPKQPVEQAKWVDPGQRGGVLGGDLWFSNLHRRLSFLPQPNAQAPIRTLAQRGNGVTRVLSRMDGGAPVSWEQPHGTDRLYAPSSPYYIDGTENVQETYDWSGRLTEMVWTDGTHVWLSYSGGNAALPGMLIQASDNRGHSLSFSYVDPGSGAAPRLSTITDAAGRVTMLDYDGQGNLASIGWPDGRTRGFVYDESLPWALTGLIDERGVRYASFGYDAAGRAISTEHAGGVGRYSVSYATPPTMRIERAVEFGYAVHSIRWDNVGGAVLTEPNGNTRNLDASSMDGRSFLAGQSQAAGAGSAASTSVQRFDENGNGASVDDLNGNRSCYVHDLGRNLPTVEVTGLTSSQACESVTPTNVALPAGLVKTTTQWHPDWRLPAKVASPGRITTWIYNGQPDPFNGGQRASCSTADVIAPDWKPIAMLCKQVEQATTDGDGHLGFSASLQAGPPIRVRTWTYNERGQVLTAKGTRGNVNDTVTRSYYNDTTADHTLGDLATVTDARGKVTTFNRYNKLGQVLQSTDANGAVTLNTYDLRQRLLTSSVNGRMTAYEYDPIGQLKKVTQPDGSWVGFDYDDAHRQVAAYDNRGNRIDYVLDNSGQRTATSTQDPNGALKTNLARVMDALGRLQRGTGEE